jgi:hypothetical protein
MAKSCAIIPKVNNKNGQAVDSRLYINLLAYTGNNRELATKFYQITKGSDFINKWQEKLPVDENGEFTITGLIQKAGLSKALSEDAFLKRLNREIGYYKKGQDRPALWIDNDKNYTDLTRKALNFNKNSEFRDAYVARVVRIPDTESSRIFIGVRVDKKNRMYSIEADRMEYNFNLNTRLREILASKGVSIGALTELEDRMGINGVTDFDRAREAANGIVELIRLANGVRGEKALPEEFAHFALEAMGDSILVNRLINQLNNEGVVREILGEEYDTYNTLYEGDTARLAKEAAGKLLAKHLLQAEAIQNKPYKNLLQRVINAIKEFFRSISANEIQKALYKADKEFGNLASDILSGKVDEEIQVRNIKAKESLYQVNSRVNRDKALLRKIIDNELKRLKIYEKRNPNSRFGATQRLFIDRLETDLNDNTEIEGIYSFIQSALEDLNSINNRFTSLASTPATTTKERASVLRDCRNYLFSYKNVIDDIRKALIDEEKYADNRYGQRIRVILDEVSTLLDDLYIRYNDIAMPLFVEFIKPFVGENVVVPFGKYKGKTITAEDLVEVASEDISFFDRWLDSMADSSDYMLKIMDQAVKKSKENARLSTIEVMKEIQKATLELEKAGIKDTSWMFERDSEGNLSGDYISEINHALFKENMREMFKGLNAKYGKNPVGEDANKYRQERQAWFDANMEMRDGRKQPKLSIYGNPQYTSMNAAQKKYYDTILNIKSRLDAYLPERATYLTNSVKIRKDLLERVKSSDSVKSGAKQIWESVKDEFLLRTDDIDFGSKYIIKDFENHTVQTLPIYYTKMKEGESMNDLSTDVASTMIAYAAMALDYAEMNKVIDVLELGRDLLREREITQTQGGRPMVEKFKAVGRTVESKLTKKGEETYFLQRLNDFFEMQVYGKYMADEGTFGESNISKSKVYNFVNRVTSLNSLALNVLSGISNVATGTVMMRLESFSGEFFSPKNTFNADRIYGVELPKYMSEIGSRVKVSKLALWDELFNVMQEYEQDVRSTNFDRKTWFSRMFSTSTLFFMNNAGEHWMQNRTSLALADAYKMKAPNGQIVSLWDAMEVVPIDPNNKKLGAKLQVKQGYTKEDGTEFTKEDIIAFSRKTAAINQRMHGIYNKADRSAIQRLGLGRMAIMFRKWIKPSLNRRFSKATYNYDLQAWTEGYYVTSGKFMLQLARDLRNLQFNIGAHWSELTKTEKANIIRAMTEVSHFLVLTAVIGLIEWSDDDDRPWLISMLEYQARRLKTELGSMIPGRSMVKEGLKILKSPAAGINTLEHILDLTKLLNPWNYMDELQSGRYEGHSTAYKTFFESPIVPMNKTIYKGLHPEEGIPFFKQ